MPTFAQKVAALQALADAGKKVNRCEYYKVEWSDLVTGWYGHAAYSRTPPYAGVKAYTGGDHIEARVLDVDHDYPFKNFELQPDIRTKEIPFEFDNIDKDISGKFAAYHTSRVRIYHYFPQADLNVEVWMGQLQEPGEGEDHERVRTIATNSRRMREWQVPSETHQFYCPATYGELYTTLFAQETGLCPVDTSVGGSIGVGGFNGCPKDLDACNERLGADQTNGNYHGGWIIPNVHYTSDPRLPGQTVSKSGRSPLTQAKRVLFGRKHINDLNIVAFAREPNPSHPELGFIRAVWEGPLGPIASMTNLKVNDQPPNTGQWAVVLGRLGQGRVDLTLLSIGLSGTSLAVTVNGLGNPSQFNAQNLKGECDAIGYSQVAVFTDDDPLTYTRIQTNNRIWCLLELHTNQRFGTGQPTDEFWIGHLISEAEFSTAPVVFTLTHPDGEVRDFPHQRSTLNVLLEGRSFDEQVLDICRSGFLTPPYLYQGKYRLDHFRAFTNDELTAAPVFSDRGLAGSRKIVSDDGRPRINFSYKRDHELVNKVRLVFEEFSNKGLSRPITCEDPDQQLRAGRSIGTDTFHEVPLDIAAFGVDELNEAVKVGYGYLWWGQLGDGGIHNNYRATFFVPYEYTLDLRRYQAIKIDSALNTRLTPDGDPFEYFQILYMYPAGRDWVQIIAQGYNQQKMEAFETSGTALSNWHHIEVTDAGDPAVLGNWGRGGTINGRPWYQKGTRICETYWNGTFYQFRMWRLGGGAVDYTGDDDVDYPWQTAWSVVDGIAPAPTVSEGLADSPDPPVRPLTPPVATNIEFGTPVQGSRTLIVPIAEV